MCSTRVTEKTWLERDAIEGQPSALQTSRSTLRHNGAWKCRKGTRDGHSERYTQEGRSEMSAKRYPLVIEKTTTGYSAYSPDVPGCAAVGDTEEETRQNFRDALSAHFQVMRELGEPIPEPSSSLDYVEVAA
jgi:predicted RNase H-like HicB family nuclease